MIGLMAASIHCFDGESRDVGEVCSNLLKALRWFWTVAHSLVDLGNIEQEYERSRHSVLEGAVAMIDRLPPCIHYVTNHFIEDYRQYRCLGRLICEGGEARNSIIHQIFINCTCKGKEPGIGESSSAATILTRIWGKASLIRAGVHKL